MAIIRVDYKGIEVPQPAPNKPGGDLLIDDLRILADRSPTTYEGAGNPGVNNDRADTATLGTAFYRYSKWINTTDGTIWLCLDATPTAAVWQLVAPLTYEGSGNPGVNNDSVDTAGLGTVFYQYSQWINTDDDSLWVCLDATATAAVWQLVGSVPLATLTDMNDPTGFVNRTDSTIAWSDVNWTFTIDKVGASWTFYVAGVAFVKTAAETVQLNPASEGLHYIYYDSTGTLQETNTWADALITDNALVAIVYWDATNNLGELMEERHGCNMAGQTHLYLHDQFGAVWESGLGLGDILADQDGSNNTHAQFSVATGEIYDEDIATTTNAIASGVGLEIWYLDGANWRKTTNAGYSFITDGVTGRIAYNNAGAQTAVTDGNFVLVHVFATNFVDGNPIAIQGQAQYSTLNAARDGAETEINSLNLSGMPGLEMKPIGTVIFQTKDSYTNAVKARIRATDGGDDYVDFRVNAGGRGEPANDHGVLGGLTDNDHPQYVIQGLDSNTYSIRPTYDGATAGNARGENSVDHQTLRSAATMVASGARSVIGGGQNNTASGANTVVGGGYGNIAPQSHDAIVGGKNNVITTSGYNGYNFIGGGRDNALSADRSVIAGGRNHTITSSGYGPYCVTISGGRGHTMTDPDYATIGGGYVNTISRARGTIGGGQGNEIKTAGTHGFIGGGHLNEITQTKAAIAGGYQNAVSGAYGAVVGGQSNTASGSGCFVGGGRSNTAGGYDNATIGGGGYNTASAYYSTIAGGRSNTASGVNSAVGGGRANTAGAYYSTVGGGFTNAAGGGAGASRTTISGGDHNWAGDVGATIGGGCAHNTNAASTVNQATGVVGGTVTEVVAGKFSTIGGGQKNTATGDNATVGGGRENTASGTNATVGGGYNNTSSTTSTTVGGGLSNTASGVYAAVCGGSSNEAKAHSSFIGGGVNNDIAAGNYRAAICGGYNNTITANADNSFVGGGYQNTTDAENSVIGGGYQNSIATSRHYSVIGGGQSNEVKTNGTHCFIGGGLSNDAIHNYAAIAGGTLNTAGYGAFVGAGNGNAANPSYAVIGGGYQNSVAASRTYGVIGGGQDNQIKTAGTHGFIGCGQANAVTATHCAIGGGRSNTTGATYSMVPGGYQAVTSRYGERAQASGRFAADGDCQNGEIAIRRSTTHSDATWYTLNPDGTTAGTFITIPEDSVMTFDALVSGITAGCAQTFSFQIRGCIENDGGTTAMKGTPVIDYLDRSDDSDFDIQAIASDANDALLIQVQDSSGDSNYTVRWGGNVRWQSTTFPAP